MKLLYVSIICNNLNCDSIKRIFLKLLHLTRICLKYIFYFRLQLLSTVNSRIKKGKKLNINYKLTLSELLVKVQ